VQDSREGKVTCVPVALPASTLANSPAKENQRFHLWTTHTRRTVQTSYAFLQLHSRYTSYYGRTGVLTVTEHTNLAKKRHVVCCYTYVSVCSFVMSADFLKQKTTQGFHSFLWLCSLFFFHLSVYAFLSSKFFIADDHINACQAVQTSSRSRNTTDTHRSSEHQVPASETKSSSTRQLWLTRWILKCSVIPLLQEVEILMQ